MYVIFVEICLDLKRVCTRTKWTIVDIDSSAYHVTENSIQLHNLMLTWPVMDQILEHVRLILHLHLLVMFLWNQLLFRHKPWETDVTHILGTGLVQTEISDHYRQRVRQQRACDGARDGARDNDQYRRIAYQNV